MTTALKQFSSERLPVGEAAFTLIELLIALAISAVILTAISTVFFGAIHMRNRTTEIAEQSLPIDTAVAIMKRDLMGIVPPGVLAGPMGSDAVGIGMTQPIMLEIFTGSGQVNADEPWGDLQKIDFSLQAPTNRNNYAGRDLMRGVTRNLLPSTTVAPDQQTLLEDVQDLKFTYYDGTNWNDSWSTTLSNIPIAIRVNIAFSPVQNGAPVRPPVQFLVPVVAWSNTNSITNQISN